MPGFCGRILRGVDFYTVRSLEAKVPAPVVALAVGWAMWLVSGDVSPPDAGASVREHVHAVAMYLSGALAVAAFVALWWTGTTFNPFRPERAAKLVTGGVYAF